MIALISPAKSLDFEARTSIHESTLSPFAESTEYLINKLVKKSPRQLKKMMGISDDLAELNATRYADWGSAPLKQAVFAFNGDVYQGLDATNFSAGELAYAQDHLRIVSGLYGLLRPLDLIAPYRLEMGTKWKITGKKANLYDFWGDKIAESLRKDIARTNSRFVLNLASQEYARAARLNTLGVPVVSPVFKEERAGAFKMISFFAKKARGMMAAFAMREHVSEPEDLLKFDREGYGFNARLSNIENNQWVYTRKTT